MTTYSLHDVDTCTAMQKTNYICIFVVFTTSRFYSASERASRCQITTWIKLSNGVQTVQTIHGVILGVGDTILPVN